MFDIIEHMELNAYRIFFPTLFSKHFFFIPIQITQKIHKSQDVNFPEICKFRSELFFILLNRFFYRILSDFLDFFFCYYCRIFFRNYLNTFYFSEFYTFIYLNLCVFLFKRLKDI